MTAVWGMRALALCAALTPAACASFIGDEKGPPKLHSIRSENRGPDEFTVLPYKPLEMPQDLAQLPPPTPGGRNITDPTPEADAVAALGGNPGALGVTQPAARNAGLLAYTARYGTASNIRGVLAAEDLDWRERHNGRLLERVAKVDVYYKAYAPMSLDQYQQLEYWRSRGIRTVSAPPEGEKP